jgi:hypothetical protein
MMTRKRMRATLMVWYVIIGVLVFGYNASTRLKYDNASYVACTDDPIRHECREPDGADIVGGSLFAGAFWPLYASWTLFDQITPTPGETRHG